MEEMDSLKHQLHISIKKSIMWILFSNKNVGALTREKISHYYTHEIEKEWTPVEPSIKEIRVGKT